MQVETNGTSGVVAGSCIVYSECSKGIGSRNSHMTLGCRRLTETQIEQRPSSPSRGARFFCLLTSIWTFLAGEGSR